jgi:hypothetical protein
MCAVLISLLAGLTSTLRTRASLQVEILALRHQLVVLQRNRQKRVSLRAWDRILWVALVRLWPEWRQALITVKPETVISWHRKAFRFYWNWRSRRGRIGQPGVSKKIRDLIREMNSAICFGHSSASRAIIPTSPANASGFLQKTLSRVPRKAIAPESTLCCRVTSDRDLTYVDN